MNTRPAPAAKPGRSRLTRLAVTTAATAALAAGSLAAAAPASAVALVCPAGSHCLYAELGERPYVFTASKPDLRSAVYPNGEPVAGNIAAAANFNTAGLESHFYDGVNYAGFLFCLNPGRFGNLPPTVANRVDSVLLRPRTAVACL